MTELSRNAPGTGSHANEGVREKLVCGGSSARRRKPCRPVGALSADRAAPAPTASVNIAASSMRRRAVRIVSHVCRQSWSRASPSDEGCEQLAGGEDERIGSGGPDELDGGGKPLLGRATREGERRPAEGIEREGQRDPPLADRQLVDVVRRGDERDGRRYEQIDRLSRFVASVAVRGAKPAGDAHLLVGHLRAALQ